MLLNWSKAMKKTLTNSRDRWAIAQALAEFDPDIVALALTYAQGLVVLGVDVTKECNTAAQSMEVADRAYSKGYEDGYNKGKKVAPPMCSNCDRYTRTC